MLGCFRSGDKLLGNQEIAQRCGLPKSTVSRITHTLTALGYLIHVPEQSKYRLGTATLTLGSSMLSRLDVRRIARPWMRKLATSVGAEVALATRDRQHMVYLEHCPSPSYTQNKLDMGSRLPLATSAIGRAWLAASPAAERQQALDYLRIHAPDQWQSVQAQLPLWPSPGNLPKPWLTTSMGEWIAATNAIALAFSPRRGLPLMAISLGGPERYVNVETLRHQGIPALQRMVHFLQQEIDRA